MNKFDDIRTKIFRTKFAEKDESNILGELRMLGKCDGCEHSEREATKRLTFQNC